jgi:transglutaminase-like putative cysteine protease
MVASGEDINSMYLNPAGLGYIFYNEISTSYNNAFGIGLHNGYIAFAFPLQAVFNTGIGYEYLIYNDGELSVSDHFITIAVARNAGLTGLYAGISAGYHFSTAEIDEEIADEKSIFSLNTGIIYDNFDFIKFLKPLKIGFLAQDIINTESSDISWRNLFSRFRWSVGMSYTFLNVLNFEATLYPDTINSGFEFWLYRDMIKAIFRKIDKAKEKSFSFSDRLWSFRGGVIYDRKYEDTSEGISRLIWTLGSGISTRFITLDYGLQMMQNTSLDHNVSLSFKFGFASSYIKVTDSEIKDLFSSMYKSYKDLSVGYIKLKNNARQNLTLDIDFFIKGYMDSATSRRVIIRSGREQLFPLYAVFNQSILQIEEDKPLQAEITYTYTYNKKKIVKKITQSFTMYEKNAFTWTDKKQIAVFVTPNDPVIADFTRQIIQLYKGETSGMLPPNFEKAMQIFNALGTYGITYVRDPNSPYTQAVQNQDIVDNIQYPSETLRLKTGDCDDSTVLYCSMLESIGIQTAIIDMPGHVLMMFNTGVKAAEASRISTDPDDYYLKGDEVWIFIETTMFKNGFFKAWKEGMLEFKKWQAR